MCNMDDPLTARAFNAAGDAMSLRPAAQQGLNRQNGAGGASPPTPPSTPKPPLAGGHLLAVMSQTSP